MDNDIEVQISSCNSLSNGCALSANIKDLSANIKEFLENRVFTTGSF
tara:strand:- start:1124 stop:1264 length:141 start_codon:yes stop_codon:yes gene_type:complete